MPIPRDENYNKIIPIGCLTQIQDNDEFLAHILYENGVKDLKDVIDEVIYDCKDENDEVDWKQVKNEISEMWNNMDEEFQEIWEIQYPQLMTFEYVNDIIDKFFTKRIEMKFWKADVFKKFLEFCDDNDIDIDFIGCQDENCENCNEHQEVYFDDEDNELHICDDCLNNKNVLKN